MSYMTEDSVARQLVESLYAQMDGRVGNDIRENIADDIVESDEWEALRTLIRFKLTRHMD